MTSRFRRIAVPLITASALALATAACGGSDTAAGGPSAAPTEKIQLKVGLFGDLGFKPLYEEFKKTHPNVEIVENITQFNDHHNNLVKRLATNAGAGDVEAVEVGYISTFTAQPQKFHDLKQYGLDKRQGDYLDWKWQQGLSKQGGQVLGLGTDVGGLAMCYRKDLFKKAGLPEDRDEGRRALAHLGGLHRHGQEVRRGGRARRQVRGRPRRDLPRDRQPGPDRPVRRRRTTSSWTPTRTSRRPGTCPTRSPPRGLTAKLAAFTPPWNTGFAKGSFATIICPAWMTGFIQEQAKDATGKWDIATVPGGSGNSGGSHLMVPKQSKHPKEAAELVDFLTTKDAQAKVFKEEGIFPSIPALYDDPSIQSFTKPFFGDAPIGKIYSEAAKALKPQHLGPKEADVRTAIGNGLGRVEQGKQTPDESWAQVLEDVKKIK